MSQAGHRPFLEAKLLLHNRDIGYTFGLSRERRLPWKECNVKEERVTFIVRVLKGEKVATAGPVVRDLIKDKLKDHRTL